MKIILREKLARFLRYFLRSLLTLYYIHITGQDNGCGNIKTNDDDEVEDDADDIRVIVCGGGGGGLVCDAQLT